ncbi:hypothetical protein BJX70DRAFT_289753 [Aspergillus crustosus]
MFFHLFGFVLGAVTYIAESRSYMSQCATICFETHHTNQSRPCPLGLAGIKSELRIVVRFDILDRGDPQMGY